MSVWSIELTRLDGEIKAYVKIQNEWTGSIRESLRKVRCDKNGYYCMADGSRIDLNMKRDSFVQQEEYDRAARKWFRETKH